MPSLKEYRIRIASVTSTRKITAAMKMVAASKLRRAQEQAEIARPYAQQMRRLLEFVASETRSGVVLPKLVSGTGAFNKQLLIVFTSDRGLCAGFNANVVRDARRHLYTLIAEGKDVSIITVGRKGRELLKREFSPYIVESFEGIGKKHLTFADAQKIAARVFTLFDAGKVDVATMFYNRFNSVISQVPMARQLIPFYIPRNTEPLKEAHSVHEFEPSQECLLNQLVPQNVTMQIFRALLESAAGEQAARMTAMDNATRNASEMIAKLTLKYNRARQAYITKELIEIISGADAVG